jgi:hypothetical protein
MEGEIISWPEQLEANGHADVIETIIQADPTLRYQLEPIQDFLYRLAWKGSA